MGGSRRERTHGERSFCVGRGGVETPILKELYAARGAKIRDGQMARWGGRSAAPDEMAKVIVFALSEDAAWLNGTDIVVDGGGGIPFYFDMIDVDAEDAAKTFFGR